MRWLLIGTMIFGISTGLRDGWLIIKWSQFLHEIGFTSVDPKKPLNWSEFLLERLGIESSEDLQD